MFKEGDLVWLHMRKDHFAGKRKNKLMPKAEGPYKVVGRVNDNAYKLELPGDYGVHATFNVGDLTPYLDDEVLIELRSIPFQGGGDDTGLEAKNDKYDELALSMWHGDVPHDVARFVGMVTWTGI